jgi:hypothetical protein
MPVLPLTRGSGTNFGSDWDVEVALAQVFMTWVLSVSWDVN